MSKLILDALCKMPETLIRENKIEVLDVEFYVNDLKFSYPNYFRKDYLNVFDEGYQVQECPLDLEYVEKFFSRFTDEGEDVLYVSTIDKKSINYFDIKSVINKIKDKHLGNITVIELPSRNLCVRNVIFNILELRKNKEKDDKIKSIIEKKLNEYTMLSLLDDKKIISRLNARPSQSLTFGIKPIYSSKINGEMELVSREDGLTNGINKLMNILSSFVGENIGEISIQYAKSAKHSELLERLLRKIFTDVKIEKVIMDPASIQEFGIGAINVAFKGLL